MALLAVGFGFAWIGHALMFSSFMLYDDEGYVLITLRDFGLHGGLYNQVYSQYGPFFYLCYDTLHRVLGFEWTSSSGRWITLINWLGTAGLCSAIVARCRLPLTLVAFTFASVFTLLWINVREPTHPGSFTSLLVALAALLGAEALQGNRPRRFAIAIGVIGSAVALVKINVGAFIFLAALSWLTLSGSTRKSGAVPILLAGLGLLLPFVLMRSLLGESWVLTFAFVSGASIAGAMLAAAPVARTQPTGIAAWGWLAGPAVLVALIVSVATLARGTGPMDLLEGVLLGPLRHPGAYAFAVNWRTGTLAIATLALLCSVYLHGRTLSPGLVQGLAWTRIALTGLFQLPLLPGLALSQAGAIMSYGVALAALFAWPLASANRPRTPEDYTRAWLTLLLVFQAMHAYPVAGSQINWGTFLWIPLMVLGLRDAAVALKPGPASDTSVPVGRLIQGTAAALVVLMGWSLASVASQYRKNGDALALPGAERLLLPATLTSAIRVAVANAKAHSDMLITLPGSYSLNLWSGVPTPTQANATHWFSLLSTDQQHAIITQLESAERPMLIVQNHILNALVHDDYQPSGPLYTHLHQSFERAFTVDGYGIWVHKGRTIAPIQTATLTVDGGVMFLTTTVAPLERPVAALQLRDLNANTWVNLGTDQAFIQALSPENRPEGEAVPAIWPLRISSLSRLELPFVPSVTPPSYYDGMEIVLLDADGGTLASARILLPAAFGPRTP